jgi:hypothetical protein
LKNTVILAALDISKTFLGKSVPEHLAGYIGFANAAALVGSVWNPGYSQSTADKQSGSRSIRRLPRGDDQCLLSGEGWPFSENIVWKGSIQWSAQLGAACRN